MKPVLSQFKNFILDMDGVLWRGKTPLPGLEKLFSTLKAHQMRTILATNNSTTTPHNYVNKLADFGVAIQESQIITSGMATVNYLKSCYDAGISLFVIGEPGLKQILTQHGFNIINSRNNDSMPTAVVAGLDRGVTYEKLKEASLFISDGAAFIGTNPDTSFPTETGEWPGAGAILASIEAATRVKPTVIGKPGKIMFTAARQQLGGQARNTIMIGDRLETDILGAKNAGIASILLLSGVTSRTQLENSAIQPDFVFAGINELADAINEAAQSGK